MKKVNIILAFSLAMLLLASCSLVDKEVGDMTQVKMTAVITAIGEKIEVEVVESENGATGPFWIITGIDTLVFDKSGNRALLSSLKVGDTVDITYGGQVMMSYPPQIVAKKIQIK